MKPAPFVRESSQYSPVGSWGPEFLCALGFSFWWTPSAPLHAWKFCVEGLANAPWSRERRCTSERRKHIVLFRQSSNGIYADYIYAQGLQNILLLFDWELRDGPDFASTYLTQKTTVKPYNFRYRFQKFAELLVIITEVLAEHHTVDHIGHCAAQQKCGVKWFS